MPSNADIQVYKFTSNPSLGYAGSTTLGAVSSTVNSLFDSVQPAEASSGSTEYRMIAIKNASVSDTMVGLKLYMSAETTSASTTLEFALKGINYDAPNTWPAALASETTAPEGVTFSAASGLGNAILIGDLQPGKYALFYVKRIVSPGAAQLSADSGSFTITNAVA